MTFILAGLRKRLRTQLASMKSVEPWNSTRRYGCAGVAVNAAMAVFAAGAFGALLYQIRESEKSGAASERAIADGLIQSKRAADAAVAIAEETQRVAAASERSAIAARDIARLEQRAWVGPLEMDRPSIVEGKPLIFTVYVTNTGKTPALRVVHIVHHVGLSSVSNS